MLRFDQVSLKKSRDIEIIKQTNYQKEKGISPAFFLPHPAHPLFGREREIQSFFHYLSRKRIFSVQGMAGIGKTFFLSHLAGRLNCTPELEQFRGKTFFFEVKEGWQSQTFIGQLYFCLKKAGISVPSDVGSGFFEPVSEKLMDMLSFLNSGSYAIFIDDFHFFPAESQIELLRPLLKYLRTSKVIFSSCTDISISPMEKLEIWETRLNELEASSTISLFREFTETRDQKKLGERDLLAVHRKTGGHPFTIKLLASVYLSSHLDLGKVMDLSSHYSKEVRAFLVKRVVENLSEAERNCLELFLFLHGSIDPTCLEQFVDEEILAAVHGLIDKLLLDQTPEGRIRLHSLIREHGRDLIPTERAKRNHVWWAEFFHRHIDSGPPRAHGDFLIEYVFHLVMGGSIEKGKAAMENFLIDMYLQGRFDEIMSLIKLLQENSVTLSGKVLITKAKILYLQGRWQESRVVLEDLRKAGDKGLQAQILMCLGHIEVCRDKVKSAIELYRQSLELAEQFRQIGEQAEAHFYLGDSFFYLRQFEKALTSYQLSGQLYEKIDDTAGMTDALTKKALVFQNLGRLREAREILCESVRTYSESRNLLGLADAHLNLATLAFREREFELALTNIDRCMSIFFAQRNALKILFLRILQGKIFYFQNNHDEAWTIFSEAFQMAKEYDQTDETAEASFFLSRILFDRRDYSGALERIGSFPNLYDSMIGARLDLLKCFIFAWRREFSPAVKAAEDALSWANSEGKDGIRSLIELVHRLIAKSGKTNPPVEEPKARVFDSPECVWPESAELEKYLPPLLEVLKVPKRKILTPDGELLEFNDAISAWKKEFAFDLLFDLGEGCVYIKGTGPVDLRQKPRMSRLLELFMRNPGKKFKPSELYLIVWEQEFEAEIHDSNVRSHISRLRKSIEPVDSSGGFTFILKPTGKNEYYLNSNIRYCLILAET